ncbi:MAG TPA: autotransporter outer membrane beta-barrel domain-containing protein [Novosphingobium sp.]|nr:autotransporter outer membrane beta-barrel domain-containing protein [Novosphingobium sp.]
MLPALLMAAMPGTALAQEREPENAETYGPPAPVIDDTAAAPEAPKPEVPDRRYPLFPIGAKTAIERGYKVQRALGFSGMMIHNVQNMDSDNLAIALAKGSPPPQDATLVEVPFVTTDRLESHTSNSQFKVDLWILPFFNAFAAVGKVKGHIDIAVDIDLDALVPPPICRPADPCGTVRVPFTGHVDNTTVTLGGVLAYGSNDWAVMGVYARTVSTSSNGRSDVSTTDASARIGPRLHFDDTFGIMPYVGVNYFKLDATVDGTVSSGPVFRDGDPIGLRYRVDLSSRHPWAVVSGFNLEIGPQWALQAEYDWGDSSDRFMISATFRP